MYFKDSVYWRIYSDVWAYHKRFCEPKGDDVYWEEVIREANVIRNKYKGLPEDKFVNQLLLAIVDELEDYYRRNQSESKKERDKRNH